MAHRKCVRRALARWASVACGVALVLGSYTIAAAANVDPSTITIDPPAPLRMGEDPSGTIVAHLTQVGGQPVGGARLDLYIDGTAAASDLTNGDGIIGLNFHRELLPGVHDIQVRFNGNRAAAASIATATLSVLPVDSSRLAIDPLPSIQIGQDPTVTVVAHLISDRGAPVVGARLDLLLDAIPASSGITDPTGTAQLTFRRVLAVGGHRVDLKFAGSRVAAATSATAQFSVQPVDNTRLIVDALPTLQVGQDPSVSFVGHLMSSSGQPVGGARIDVMVDGTSAGSSVTDAQGTVQINFRRELAAGDHQVNLKFEGSRVVGPATASTKLSVRPIAVNGLTVDPIPGLQVGQDPTVTTTAHLLNAAGEPVPGARLSVFVDAAPAGSGVTGADGNAQLTFRRELAAGDHQVEVRFNGSRAAAPASTTVALSVADIAVHGLTIDPLPRLQVGQDPGGTVVAHLVADSGDAVPGGRLSLFIDGVPAGSAVTDDHGMAQIIFRRDLAAGDHDVAVNFAGSRAAAATRANTRLSVAPIAVNGLAMDALPAMQAGQDPALTVVAHMTTESGAPVSGARLDLLIDSTPAGVGLTDASGTAPINFRRQLVPGEHQVELRFGGSRAAAPASLTRPLTVLPGVGSNLTLDPLPSIRIGTDSVVNVVAHLADDSGAPVPGARLELLIDAIQQRLGSTDATGMARLQFHPDLEPGDHEVQVQFGGVRGLTPGSVTATLHVLPHELQVQVTPAVAGASIAVNGQVFTSDDQGIVRLTMNKPGAYHVEALPWSTTEPGKKLEFSRWGDEVFTPGRDIIVPQVSRLEVGFNTRNLVSLSYLDPDNHAVDLGRIASATVMSSVGASQTFRPTEKQWVDATRVVRRPGGLGETQLQYSVDNVQLEGANVVNSQEQRFYPAPNLDFPVHLLLYAMRIDARAAVAGTPIGSGIWLKHPDGHSDWNAFGPNAQLELRLLPRGQYVAQVVAQGVTFAEPIALSKDQQVDLRVITYAELTGAIGLLATLAVGLLLVGRRHALFSLFRPRTALPSGYITRRVRGGRVAGEENLI